MNLLLDTHTLLWSLGEPERLRTETQAAITRAENVVHVSVVSLWEIEIKRASGKLTLASPLADHLRAARFAILVLEREHVDALRDLPRVHRDPFDRMLVAQAIAEKLVLVTRDHLLPRYPVRTMRA